MLCDDLEGWDRGGGGREVQEGGAICTHITAAVLHQKLTRSCKAIIFQ